MIMNKSASAVQRIEKVRESLRDVYGERYDDYGLDDYVTQYEIRNDLLDDKTCRICTMKSPPLFLTSGTTKVSALTMGGLMKKALKELCSCETNK